MTKLSALAALAAIAGIGALGVLTTGNAVAQTGSRPATDVRVVNTPTVNVSTMPDVRVLNERTPVRFQFSFNFDSNSGVSAVPNAEQYVVPEGKVLVLESLSISLPDSGYQITITDNNVITNGMGRPDSNGHGSRTAHQLIAMRMTEGHMLGLIVARDPNVETELVTGTFNGYLEPAPLVIE